MQLTNKYNYPSCFVNFWNSQSNGKKRDYDYSVTELIKSPMQHFLTKKHYDEIKVDIEDEVWKLYGTMMHNLFDKYSNKEDVNEERMIVERNGIKIGGKPDLLQKNGVILDYKVTSAWTIIYKSSFEDWEKQLNCYAWLFRKNGYEIKALKIFALLRDWTKSKTRDDNYPKTKGQWIDIPLWDIEKQENYIKERIKLFEKCKAEQKAPICNEKERWAQPTKWAMMKKGRKSAVKLFDDENTANEFMGNGNEYYIEKRPGKDNKCVDYCSANKWCSYYKKTYGGINGK